MKWKKLFMQACIIAMLLFASPAISSEKGVNVSMMIDCNLYPYDKWPDLGFFNETEGTNATNPDNSTQDEIEATSLIIYLLNEIDGYDRDLNVTLFVAGDYLSKKPGGYSYRLLISKLSNRANHEMALHGTRTNETLANLDYQEQLSRISNSKKNVEDAHICTVQADTVCSGRAVNVKGFKPQSLNFSQNNDTKKILQELNFSYNAGYQAGLIYEPAHKDDTKPYSINNSTLYAVPVSTHNRSGTLIPLWDRFVREQGLNGSQWYELLSDEYLECAANGDPMVVIFTNFIVGMDKGYLDAYRRFVSDCISKGAKFVTTQQLVDMSKPKSLAAPEDSGMKMQNATADDSTKRLAELKKMVERGVLTQAEYDILAKSASS